MKIKDYPKAQTLDEKDVVLIDGDSGTRTVSIKESISTATNLKNGTAENTLSSKNAKAMSDGSVSFGDNSIAGSKCFKILGCHIDGTYVGPGRLGFKLDSIDGLAVGDVVSVYLNDLDYTYYNLNPIERIEQVDKEVIVQVDNTGTDLKDLNVPISSIGYLWVLDKPNIGTDDDRKHLLFIQENYEGKILFVVNKVDRFRRGEDSIEETLKKVVFDLTNLGFENPEVVPVSSYAAYLAKMSIFSETLDEDDQDEYERLSRKMKKEEYQLGRYYPEEVRENIDIGRKDQNRLLLLHSGLLHLEKMIYNYNMR